MCSRAPFQFIWGDSEVKYLCSVQAYSGKQVKAVAAEVQIICFVFARSRLQSPASSATGSQVEGGVKQP